MKEKTPVSTEKKVKKLFYYILVVAVINIILWFIAGSANTTYAGHGIGQSLFGKLLIFYTGVIISGFIVGVFVSFLPYKGISFGHKYLRSSLLSILALSLLLLLFIIRSIIIF